MMLVEELIRVEGVVVECSDRLSFGIKYRLIRDHKCGVVAPRLFGLHAPFLSLIGVARREVLLTFKYQPLVGEGACGRRVYEHLRRLPRIRARVLVAARGRPHEFSKRLFLFLQRALRGDDVRRGIVGDAVRIDGEGREREPATFRLDALPRVEYPREINALTPQSFKRVHVERDVLKSSRAAVGLYHGADDRLLEGRAVSAVYFSFNLCS